MLDGEALLVDEAGRPRSFQETASRSMTISESEAVMTPYFFDVLHLDGRDLLDEPAEVRAEALAALVPRRTSSHGCARPRRRGRCLPDRGPRGRPGGTRREEPHRHLGGRASRRWLGEGEAPAHPSTWSSSPSSGAPDAVAGCSPTSTSAPATPDTGADSDKHWVMLGKTFKGMTDEMLAWQTERFLSLETSREDHVVHLRPEQVVEIAFDGLQRSTRYPGASRSGSPGCSCTARTSAPRRRTRSRRCGGLAGLG